MKFICKCGHEIIDQTDDLPFKAYSVPDESMEALFSACDYLLRTSDPGNDIEKDRLLHDIIHPKGGRQMYQCPECGRIHIRDNNGDMLCFKSEDDKPNKELFAGHE